MSRRICRSSVRRSHNRQLAPLGPPSDRSRLRRPRSGPLRPAGSAPSTAATRSRSAPHLVTPPTPRSVSWPPGPSVEPDDRLPSTAEAFSRPQDLSPASPGPISPLETGPSPPGPFSRRPAPVSSTPTPFSRLATRGARSLDPAARSLDPPPALSTPPQPGRTHSSLKPPIPATPRPTRAYPARFTNGSHAPIGASARRSSAPLIRRSHPDLIHNMWIRLENRSKVIERTCLV